MGKGLRHMRGSKKFCQMGPTLTLFFCFYLMRGETERIQIQLKGGHHLPSREMPFQWHFAGVTMMTQLKWPFAGGPMMA